MIGIQTAVPQDGSGEESLCLGQDSSPRFLYREDGIIHHQNRGDPDMIGPPPPRFVMRVLIAVFEAPEKTVNGLSQNNFKVLIDLLQKVAGS